MTINEITQRLNSKMMQDGERVQFVTVLYGQIMEMNLDDLKIPVLIERWFVFIYDKKFFLNVN